MPTPTTPKRPTASAWIMKTEPDTYSMAQLIADGRTNWSGIRNFQARNYLREAQVGDAVLIYHTGDEKAVVGIARVAKAAYRDLEPEDADGGDWSQVDLEPVAAFENPVSLARLKAEPKLGSMLLVRHSRLSVSPVTPDEFALIVKLSGESPTRVSGKRPSTTAKKTAPKAAKKPAPSKVAKTRTARSKKSAR